MPWEKVVGWRNLAWMPSLLDSDVGPPECGIWGQGIEALRLNVGRKERSGHYGGEPILLIVIRRCRWEESCAWEGAFSVCAGDGKSVGNEHGSVSSQSHLISYYVGKYNMFLYCFLEISTVLYLDLYRINIRALKMYSFGHFVVSESS